MTEGERLFSALHRRKRLEVELRDAEILVALVKKHAAEADRIIEELREMARAAKASQLPLGIVR